MKRLLLVLLAIWVMPVASMAQQSNQLILRHNDGSKTYTIKRGDFVKIRMKETSEIHQYRGTFRQYENGLIYLKGKPGIQADQVQSISYRPLISRIMFWGLLLPGAMLAGLGFILTIVTGNANVAAAGLFILGFSIFLQIVSLKHVRNVPGNWTLEQWSPPSPAQKLTPIP